MHSVDYLLLRRSAERMDMSSDDNDGGKIYIIFQKSSGNGTCELAQGQIFIHT